MRRSNCFSYFQKGWRAVHVNTRNISYWSQTRMEPAINATDIATTNSPSDLEIYAKLKLTCMVEGQNRISMSNYIAAIFFFLFFEETLLVQTNKTHTCGGTSVNYEWNSYIYIFMHLKRVIFKASFSNNNNKNKINNTSTRIYANSGLLMRSRT